MKKLTLLLVTVLLIFGCKNSNTQNTSKKLVSDTIFSFVTVDSYSESSKDSHNYSTTLSLKKGVLYYDYDYNGYPANEEEHKQMNLNDSIIIAIKVKLKELSLYKNYEKKYTVNEKNYRVETGIRLYITTDTSKYILSIDGGRPMEIKDEVNDNLSIFFSYVENLFPKKE